VISRQSAACREAERQASTRNEAQAHSFEDHSPSMYDCGESLISCPPKASRGIRLMAAAFLRGGPI
jgi:hypothetical protein